MELIDRYIYAVIRKLPRNQRQEVDTNLRKLIDERLKEEDYFDNPNEVKLKETLLSLDSPSKMADNYRQTKAFPFSSAFFESYIRTLKIVFFAMFVVITVAHAIPYFIEPVSIFQSLYHYLGSLVNISIQVFLLVTAIFFVLDYRGKRVNDSGDVTWQLKDLPPLPTPKGLISKGEAIAGIVFSVVFLIIVAFFTYLLGIPIILDGQLVSFIPLLNVKAAASFLPLILLVIGLGIVKDILKIKIGKWTKFLALWNLLINLISVIIIVFVVSSPSFWNPNFILDLSQSGMLDPQGDIFFVITQIWENASKIIVFFLIVGHFIDTVIGVIKGFRTEKSIFDE